MFYINANLFRSMSWRGCLLEINLVYLNLPVDQFVNVDHNTKAIDVHEDKARVDVIGDAAIRTCCRSGVNHDTSLMFVSCKLMGMTSDKDVYV